MTLPRRLRGPLLGVLAAAGLVLTAHTPAVVAAPTAAEPVTTVTMVTTTHILTSLDDVRACAPLADGGWAAATGGGLVLVDPAGRVRTLTSLDGLPETRVHAVVATPSGLWAGTERGAALVDGGRVLGLCPNHPERCAFGALARVTRTVGAGPIHAIHASPAGAVYLGTEQGTVLRVAGAGAPSTISAPPVGKRVTAITEHAGILHVAYADGPLARLEHGALVSLPGAPTHGQALASAGARLWAGDLEGLFRLQAPGFEATSVASMDVRSLAISGTPPTLLVASYGSGLLRQASPDSATLRAEPGVPRWVRAVAARGALRCAATTEGLFVDEGGGFRRLPLGGPPSNDVTTLAASSDGKRVVIGTFDHGAVIHEGGRLLPIEGLAADEAVNAAAWQGEVLWLGTAHGLVRIEGSRVVRRLRQADGLPSSIVRAIQVAAEDLVVGTEEGAAVVTGNGARRLASVKKGTRATIASPMHATWAIARAPDGTIYLGTSTGLYHGRLDQPEAFARSSVASGDLPDDWVTALAIRGSDLFAGTYAGGVVRLTLESGRPVLSEKLGGGYVNPDGLTLHGDELLAATMDGLLVRPLRPTKDMAPSWTRRDNAATGIDVTAARIVGGQLWVASRRGIVVQPEG